MYGNIIAGVVAGVGYAITGWQKNKAKSDFQWLQLGKSVLICGIVGGVAGFSGSDFSVILTGTAGIGVTKLVDLAWSFFKKK